MNISDIHPDELTFINFIAEMEAFVQRRKEEYIDEDVKEKLINIRQQVLSMYTTRGLEHFEIGQPENVPEHEVKLFERMDTIIECLDEMIGDKKINEKIDNWILGAWGGEGVYFRKDIVITTWIGHIYYTYIISKPTVTPIGNIEE